MESVNSNMFIQPEKLPAVFSRHGGGALINEGGVFAATIIEKGIKTDKLTTDDKQLLTLPSGKVAGEVGERVFFEAQKQDGVIQLRQVFPNEEENNFTKAMTKQLSAKQLSGILSNSGAGSGETAEKARKAIESEKARLAAVRVKNSADAAFTDGFSARGELAAMGLDIEKLPIKMLNAVIAELQLSIDEGADPLDLSRAIRLIQTDARLTAANIKSAKSAPAAETEMDAEAWEELKPSAEDTLDRLGYANGSNGSNKEDIGIGDIAGNAALAQAFAENGVPLTGRNLEKAKLLLDGGAGETTRKRQIAEVRLRWMTEAAARLEETGVKINIKQFRDDVERLRKLEDEDNARALRQMGAEARPENLRAMRETITAVRVLPMATYKAFEIFSQSNTAENNTAGGKPFGERFTLNETARTIANSYEASATAPSAKFGDTFKKIAGEVAPLLEKLGFEPTNKNVRAANILIKNNAEINAQNMDLIRGIDAKVSAVANRLHPLIAAKMIEEGMKPANMNIDDILAYIEKFAGKYGENDGDKLARYIARLDNSGDATDWARHRGEIMNIYKSLYKANGDGGASLALVAESGEEITLRHLSEMADIYKSGRARFHERAVLRELIANAEPSKLNALIEEDGLGISITKAAEKLSADVGSGGGGSPGSNNPPPAVNPTVLAALEQAGLEVNAKNTRLAAAAKENGAIIKKLDAFVKSADAPARSAVLEALDTAELETLKSPSQSPALSPALSPIEEQAARLGRLLQSLPPTIEGDELLSLLRVQSAVDKGARTRKSVINLNGSPRELRISVINQTDAANGFSALLNINTSFGEVSARLTIKNGLTDVSAACDNPEGLERLQAFAPKLAKYLEDEGLEPGEFVIDGELGAGLFE